jgi:RNA-directed DNA polymerase
MPRWVRFKLPLTIAPRRRIADRAVARFKDRVRHLTGRNRGMSLQRMIADLNPLLRGWAGYSGISQLRQLPSLDGWVRRRLRCAAWIQWKTRPRRLDELRRLGLSRRAAFAAVMNPLGPWRVSTNEALHLAFSKARFRSLGLAFMANAGQTLSAEPPWYGPVCPVVWEG